MTMRNMRRFITAGLALLLLATAPVGFSQTKAKKPKESASARKAHEQILKAYGVYEDQALQDYVSEIGQRVAKMSELADAEWKFVVIDDDSINAFTTGCCYVYVHRGLLRNLNSESELASVLGHEVAHIANGDMVTLTLIQGVLNTFVVFLSRVIGYLVDSALRKNDEENTGPGWGYYVTSIVLDIVLGFVASMIVAWFSRQREFRADEGSAQLLGRKQPMINALGRLGQMQAGVLPSGVAAMGITGDLSKLFASHPPLEERIAHLQQQS